MITVGRTSTKKKYYKVSVKISPEDKAILYDFGFDFEKNVSEYLEKMASLIRFSLENQEGENE